LKTEFSETHSGQLCPLAALNGGRDRFAGGI
jgi:hypothetical protein